MTIDLDANSIPIGQLPFPPAAPAVTSLLDLRFPLARDDATAQLHALASLLADITARIPAAVAAARDQDYDWHDIATSLGASPTTARRRHANAHQPQPAR